jgi:hypothetical protein
MCSLSRFCAGAHANPDDPLTECSLRVSQLDRGTVRTAHGSATSATGEVTAAASSWLDSGADGPRRNVRTAGTDRHHAAVLNTERSVPGSDLARAERVKPVVRGARAARLTTESSFSSRIVAVLGRRDPAASTAADRRSANSWTVRINTASPIPDDRTMAASARRSRREPHPRLVFTQE